MRRLLQHAGLALGIAAVAVLCLASAWLAAAIGIATALVVAVDSAIFQRAQNPPAKPPDHLNVDLSRRR